MGNHGFWKGFLTGWNSRSVRYRKISDDEERKQSSVQFGVTSIVESVCGALFAAVGVWLLLHFSDYSDKSVLLMLIMLMFGVGFIATALRTWICASIDLGYQMLMNRKAIRWIALAVLIIAVAAVIVAVILLL